MGPEGGIDWAHAEALAFSSLLVEGGRSASPGRTPSGAPSATATSCCTTPPPASGSAPMQQLPGARRRSRSTTARCPSSATLGFEYGYSTAATETLVMWEAQFGDFINGAQVIVDQFIAAGLRQVGRDHPSHPAPAPRLRGPGAGALERAGWSASSSSAAEGNIRIANCTTPAQYFHLLRRQARRSRQRPLVVLTPKSLLRLSASNARLDELTAGEFHPVLDDPQVRGRAGEIRRLVVCSGKIYYDLLAEADKMEPDRPGLIRIERLYSFPEEELLDVLRAYSSVREVVWCQEEPRNMGAWSFMEAHLRGLLAEDVPLRYVGRPSRASPAEGYHEAHAAEQARIVAEALGR